MQPLAALGVRLLARGHRVAVCTGPNFRVWVEGLGLEFHRFGPDVEALSRELGERLRNPFVFAGKMRDLLEVQFDDVRAAADAFQPDVIVGGGAQGAASSVAAARRVPYFFVAYCPQILPSREHPVMVVPFHGLPRWSNALGWWTTFKAWNLLFLPAVNVQRRKLGLPALDDAYRGIFCEGRILIACDEVLAPFEDETGSFAIEPSRGPWFLDEGAGKALPEAVERFLAKPGPPVVYAGFGSMVTTDAAALTRTLLDAAERAGVRVLISAGWSRLGGGDLPAHALAAGALPHDALFPRVACVVHHGGAGTTHAALRAGIPQVIVPHLLDQYFWAHRVRAAGLGPAGIPWWRLDAASLAEAVRAALAPSAVARARTHGQRVRSRDALAAVLPRVEGAVPAAQRTAAYG